MKLLLVFLFSFFSLDIPAQIEKSGVPFFLNQLKSMNKAPVYEVDVSDIVKQNNDTSDLKINKIATHLNVSFHSSTHGSWLYLDGMKIWQITLHVPGAKSIGVLFGRYQLPAGAKMFVYSNSDIRGAFTDLNNKTYGTLMVAPVAGEYVNIELQVPQDVITPVDLEISAIKYGFKKLPEVTNPNDVNSEYCNVDIACCSDGEIKKLRNAVVGILSNGEDLCTGTLINNTAGNGRFFIITANHCISTYATAQNTIFYFNYESPYCNGPYISGEKTISGCKLLATKKSLDFSLVELSEIPPFDYFPYFSGWSLETSSVSNTFSIHHPSGDVKKYSVDNEAPEISNYPYSNSFDSLSFFHIKRWDVGTTEGGSSGGPLFNNNYRLIGTLTGGKANCQDPVDDYFSMFARGWIKYSDSLNQTKYWLDPLNTNQTNLDGMDPYAETRLHNIIMDNIDENESLITEKSDTWGYITGHNDKKYDVYAEKFHVDDSVGIVGFYINVSKAQLVSLFGKIRVQIWKDNLQDTSIIYSQYYPIDYFKEKSYTYIGLDEFYPVFGDFYIGYKLFYLSDQDTFAVYHTYPRSSTLTNTALAYKYGTGWIPIYKIIDQSNTASLDIKPIVHNPDIINYTKTFRKKDMVVYPNPASDFLYIDCEGFDPVILYLFDINGIIIAVKKITPGENTIMIDIRHLVNGLYFIKILNNHEHKFYKFIVSH